MTQIIKYKGELLSIRVPDTYKLLKDFIDNMWGDVTCRLDRHAIMRLEIEDALDDYNKFQFWINKKVNEGKLLLDNEGKILEYKI